MPWSSAAVRHAHTCGVAPAQEPQVCAALAPPLHNTLRANRCDQQRGRQLNIVLAPCLRSCAPFSSLDACVCSGAACAPSGLKYRSSLGGALALASGPSLCACRQLHREMAAEGSAAFSRSAVIAALKKGKDVSGGRGSYFRCGHASTTLCVPSQDARGAVRTLAGARDQDVLRFMVKDGLASLMPLLHSSRYTDAYPAALKVRELATAPGSASCRAVLTMPTRLPCRCSRACTPPGTSTTRSCSR